MAFTPKPISLSAVPAALDRAERYRLLNEPVEAESICLDVLAVDPDNQGAVVTLILAITDDLRTHLSAGVARAREYLPRLRDQYRRTYYAGIISERYALALLDHNAPRAGENAYQWIRDAMEIYEAAEKLRPAGEDESILRWNTCARLLANDSRLRPAKTEEYEPSFE
jgi:hypothetical protein